MFHTARSISTASWCIADVTFLCSDYFTFWMSSPGRQLTIFNTQATVAIGGSDRSRPFQGQLSGLYYNGLKVLSMAAEGNVNIKVNGSVRLVGDVPSVAGSARSTAMPPEMSTSFIETTTMMSTTTTRKHRSSSTVQVWAASSAWQNFAHIMTIWFNWGTILHFQLSWHQPVFLLPLSCRRIWSQRVEWCFGQEAHIRWYCVICGVFKWWWGPGGMWNQQSRWARLVCICLLSLCFHSSAPRI